MGIFVILILFDLNLNELFEICMKLLMYWIFFWDGDMLS